MAEKWAPYRIPDEELRGDGYTITTPGVGAMPNQIEGHLDDGRKFYFRARHGHWTLRVVPADASEDELYFRAEPVADGDDDNAGWWGADEALAVFETAIFAEATRN